MRFAQRASLSWENQAVFCMYFCNENVRILINAMISMQTFGAQPAFRAGPMFVLTLGVALRPVPP